MARNELKSVADAENPGLAPNIGWPARFLFLAYVLWLITLARQAIKVQPTTAGEEILPQKAGPIQNRPSPQSLVPSPLSLIGGHYLPEGAKRARAAR